AALRTLGRTRVAALGDTGRLAAAAAEIIELGAAHGAAAHHLDRIDDRRIEREDALDAFAERNLADREVRVHALVGAGDAHALVHLDAAAVAFDDFHADAQRVAGAEFGDILAIAERGNRLRLEHLDKVHCLNCLILRAARQRAVPPERPHGAR